MEIDLSLNNFPPLEISTLGIYGDGSDGDVTISGTTTLSRDMYYNTLLVDNGGTLKMNGYKVFVLKKLTVNASGIISNDSTGSV